MWKSGSAEKSETKIQFPICKNKGLAQFEKLWENLWLLWWLRPSFNLVRSFNPVGLLILQIDFGDGWPNLPKG